MFTVNRLLNWPLLNYSSHNSKHKIITATTQPHQQILVPPLKWRRQLPRVKSRNESIDDEWLPEKTNLKIVRNPQRNNLDLQFYLTLKALQNLSRELWENMTSTCVADTKNLTVRILLSTDEEQKNVVYRIPSKDCPWICICPFDLDHPQDIVSFHWRIAGSGYEIAEDTDEMYTDMKLKPNAHAQLAWQVWCWNLVGKSIEKSNFLQTNADLKKVRCRIFHLT